MSCNKRHSDADALPLTIQLCRPTQHCRCTSCAFHALQIRVSLRLRPKHAGMHYVSESKLLSQQGGVLYLAWEIDRQIVDDEEESAMDILLHTHMSQHLEVACWRYKLDYMATCICCAEGFVSKRWQSLRAAVSASAHADCHCVRAWLSGRSPKKVSKLSLLVRNT